MLLRWGLLVQLLCWWAPGWKPTATCLYMSWASGSQFEPWFFQKVNLQLGCILGCACILLWNNRPCNKIIFLDKISQAIKMFCLLQQLCDKNKPYETSSPWYSLSFKYQTTGRHCNPQELILMGSFQSTDQHMKALTHKRDRRTALAFLSWVQNKGCSHHTIGQMTSTLQLNIAHVCFFWDTTACRRAEECYSTFIPRGTGNPKRPGLEVPLLRRTCFMGEVQPANCAPFQPLSFYNTFSIQPAVCVASNYFCKYRLYKLQLVNTVWHTVPKIPGMTGL